MRRHFGGELEMIQENTQQLLDVIMKFCVGNNNRSNEIPATRDVLNIFRQ